MSGHGTGLLGCAPELEVLVLDRPADLQVLRGLMPYCWTLEEVDTFDWKLLVCRFLDLCDLSDWLCWTPFDVGTPFPEGTERKGQSAVTCEF